MTQLKKTARIAGLWYLMFALGPFYLLYVPSKTIVDDDAAATSALILSHEKLFRFGILAETLGAIVFVGLGLSLYRLFEDVNRHRARQMVALVLVSSALVLVGVVFNATALIVFSSGNAWASFDQHTREAIRNAPDPTAWAVERGQRNVLGTVAAPLWLVGRALTVLATLARVLVATGRHLLGRVGRHGLPRASAYRDSVPRVSAGVLGRTSHHAVVTVRRGEGKRKLA
jgi:hypothetical protein